VHGSLFFTHKVSPKNEIKNNEFEDEVILKGFNHQKEEGGGRKSSDFESGFQCAVINIEG